jgi:chlorite dismutase
MTDSPRQIVSFNFFKLASSWRHQPAEQRSAQRAEFAAALGRWNACGSMRVVGYSTMGTRAESDLMLWRICYSLEELQSMTGELLATSLGSHLEITRSFLGMTRHSRYMIPHARHKQVDMRAIRPGEHKYLFLHPLAKTAQWYLLDPDQRQKIVNEQIEVLGDYPRVKMNVIYGYGLDDWDVYIAYESDAPEDLLELGLSMRETEAYRYNQSPQPVFTCVRVTPEEMLERLG